MTVKGRFSLDTSILVYAIDRDADERHQRAKDPTKSCLASRFELRCLLGNRICILRGAIYNVLQEEREMQISTMLGTIFMPISRSAMYRLAEQLFGARLSYSRLSSRPFSLSVACLTAALAFSAPVAAHDTSEPLVHSAPAGETAKVQLASRLHSYGMEYDDPLALVTAAKLYKEVSAPVLEKGEEGPQGKTVNIDYLLERASRIARDDKEAIEKAIEAVKYSGSRHWTGIPHCHWVYREMFGLWEYVWECH